MEEHRSVIAGYDGSDEAAAAIRWAARHARQRSLPLHVVHCSLWPLLTRNLGPVPGVAGSGLERAAEAVLEEGLQIAQAAAPALDIDATLLHGLPASHLAAVSARQELVVVGSRGLGGFLGLLVGSVSLELAATASCPVAVIRSDLHPDGPVVVAVDALGSPAALSDACTLASAAQAALTVIHVHQTPAGYAHHGRHWGGDAAGAVLQEALHRARKQAPSVPVDGSVLHDVSVPHAILEASAAARMVVVGTKGQGLLRETIGSTAHAVLHHAQGPVLVSRRGGSY
ncbi:universal stress protein [Pseudarthrobacter sp. NamE2]|uniref:universal stress protein n=1 Tax=Pseudarthrobacter sp. NamE2 TaxID=2576838 RepID=UPI0010FDB28A|nr:universal stress protein [Pseudarthrobacter sp. NamE2]TLM86304.1 universal stress protein [Pseudarthrobacter sp. NamE2]